VASRLELHDVPTDPWPVGGFEVSAEGVIHPGPTVGYRIGLGQATMAYLPDHEPALGGISGEPDWTSGHSLASGVDLLLHDAQYTDGEYADRVGWGHSSVEHAVALADLAGARRLVLFHHDPDHDDDVVERMAAQARSLRRGGDVVAAADRMTLEPGGR
jgi:phosphoribosyl 1,2-cyclic phosphodiesterase